MHFFSKLGRVLSSRIKLNRNGKVADSGLRSLDDQRVNKPEITVYLQLRSN